MADRPRYVAMPLRRARREVALEPFWKAVETGLEQALMPAGLRVLRQVVLDSTEELACYERWFAARAGLGMVVGVVLTDLTPNCGRQVALRGRAVPTVIIGEPEDPMGASVIRNEGREPVGESVGRLADLGHRDIGYVTGPRDLRHTGSRLEAFQAATRSRGVAAHVQSADYSASSGAEAALALLSRDPSPTALLFDNDVMAIAALEAVQARGLQVPEDLSIIAWDDSLRCRLTDPPLSALNRDVRRIGELAGVALLQMLEGLGPMHVDEPQARLVERASIAPPQTARSALAFGHLNH